MADNPQETVTELRALIVAYVKQEAVDPIKGLGKYVGFGLGGAILMGLGFIFLELGLLRVLQEETYPHLTGNWSWVPYFIVVLVAAGVATLVWMARGRKKAKQA